MRRKNCKPYLILAAFGVISVASQTEQKYAKISAKNDHFEHITKTTTKDTLSEWDALIHAIIKVESRGNDTVVSKCGRYVGCMQLSKAYVDAVNRKLDRVAYSYEDRYDRNKSIEIFNSMNPERDIELALRRHNNVDWYKKKVINEYNNILCEWKKKK